MMSCVDLSDGSAACKIPIVNSIDDETFPQHFSYIATNIEPIGFEQTHFNGCDCVSECVPGSCPCIDRSTIKLTDDHRIDLREGFPKFYKDELYECDKQTCSGCKGKCHWRLTPENFNLEVTLFKTPHAGWAVRSRQCIEAGTFIAEFVGEVIDRKNMELRPVDYAYNLPVLYRSANKDSNIYIDPYVHGNITRFFNHSCFENLMPFRFYSRHRDKSRISLGFFASRDIVPGDELTIDYGVEWWKSKIEKAEESGQQFYCCCDWIYCLNPAPGKPQINEQKDVMMEVKRKISRNYAIVDRHKNHN